MDDTTDLTNPAGDTDGGDGDAAAWLDNLPPEQMAVLHEMLAAAERQIDEGRWVRSTAREVIERGRARRAARFAAE